MNDFDGTAPDLSAEDLKRIERGMAEMDRRRREDDYRPPPRNRAKLASMAPGMRVTPRDRLGPESTHSPDQGDDDDD